MDVVTGAFGYTGRHITRRLFGMGRQVKTLTGHPDRPNPFGSAVTALPFNFDNPAELVKSLWGVEVLYNTYWIRFERAGMTFQKAVENSRTLIKAAEDAGVRRVVHISATNPSEDSPLPYYKGKAAVEKAIFESKLTYAILRPSVIFGDEGILINNISWLLRHFPVFAVPGDGDYEIQPVFVEDAAQLAAALGQKHENEIVDAVGPEVFTFNDLVRVIAHNVGSRARIAHVPPSVVLFLGGVVGRIVGDVVLTENEVKGLIANLLVSGEPPTGHARLSEWLPQNADWIGTSYMSELAKHYR